MMKSKDEIEKAIEIHKNSNGNPCKNRERLRALYWVLEEHEKEEALEPFECSNPLLKGGYDE